MSLTSDTSEISPVTQQTILPEVYNSEKLTHQRIKRCSSTLCWLTSAEL